MSSPFPGRIWNPYVPLDRGEPWLAQGRPDCGYLWCGNCYAKTHHVGVLDREPGWWPIGPISEGQCPLCAIPLNAGESFAGCECCGAAWRAVRNYWEAHTVNHSGYLNWHLCWSPDSVPSW